tara:strand:+ start:1490 stop:2023 length:534 start_codon:yes stop_codon:yes gene_type:complete
MMSEKYKKMEGFTTSFTYIMNNLSENITDSFQGKISVKEEMYVLFIEGQKIINDSKTIWTYLEDLNEVTISEFDPEEQEISLNNIFEIYKTGFSFKFLGVEKDLRLVEIYPDDQEKSYFKILFKIDYDGLLSSFSVFDKSNSTFIYMINDFKEESLENTLFTFVTENYPEIEVIDFR